MKKVFFGLGLLIALTACQKPTDDVDATGGCTQHYVDAYNHMSSVQDDYVTSVNNYHFAGKNEKSAKKRKLAQTQASYAWAKQCERAHNECSAFFASHSGVSCDASNGKGRTEDYKKFCDDAEGYYQQIRYKLSSLEAQEKKGH